MHMELYKGNYLTEAFCLSLSHHSVFLLQDYLPDFSIYFFYLLNGSHGLVFLRMLGDLGQMSCPLSCCVGLLWGTLAQKFFSKVVWPGHSMFSFWISFSNCPTDPMQKVSLQLGIL